MGGVTRLFGPLSVVTQAPVRPVRSHCARQLEGGCHGGGLVPGEASLNTCFTGPGDSTWYIAVGAFNLLVAPSRWPFLKYDWFESHSRACIRSPIALQVATTVPGLQGKTEHTTTLPLPPPKQWCPGAVPSQPPSPTWHCSFQLTGTGLACRYVHRETMPGGKKKTDAMFQDLLAKRSTHSCA